MQKSCKILKKQDQKFCVFVFTNNIFSIKGQFGVNISHGTKYKMPLSFLPNFPQLCFIFSDRKKFFHSLHSNITLLYLYRGNFANLSWLPYVTCNFLSALQFLLSSLLSSVWVTGIIIHTFEPGQCSAAGQLIMTAWQLRTAWQFMAAWQLRTAEQLLEQLHSLSLAA